MNCAHWFFIFLFPVALFHFGSIEAQIPASKVDYICRTNLPNGHIFDGKCSLTFRGDESIFVHEEVPEQNSYINKGSLVVFKKGDPEGFPVYINRKGRYLYYKIIQGGPKSLIIIKEEIPDIDWTITGQTKTMDDLMCIKAYGVFGGRTYDVWFTPDIPVPLGPYKLGGLPGLILQAKSRDDMVAYEFVGFKANPKEHPLICKPKIGDELTWEEFEELTINRMLKVESLTNYGTNNDPPSDYTIEKDKFLIIGPYKEKRRKGKL